MSQGNIKDLSQEEWKARKEKKMARQIDGRNENCSSAKAMSERAISPQIKANKPPESPIGWNVDNPEPEYIFKLVDGKLVKEEK